MDFERKWRTRYHTPCSPPPPHKDQYKLLSNPSATISLFEKLKDQFKSLSYESLYDHVNAPKILLTADILKPSQLQLSDIVLQSSTFLQPVVGHLSLEETTPPKHNIFDKIIIKICHFFFGKVSETKQVFLKAKIDPVKDEPAQKESMAITFDSLKDRINNVYKLSKGKIITNIAWTVLFGVGLYFSASLALPSALIAKIGVVTFKIIATLLTAHCTGVGAYQAFGWMKERYELSKIIPKFEDAKNKTVQEQRSVATTAINVIHKSNYALLYFSDAMSIVKEETWAKLETNFHHVWISYAENSDGIRLVASKKKIPVDYYRYSYLTYINAVSGLINGIKQGFLESKASPKTAT